MRLFYIFVPVATLWVATVAAGPLHDAAKSGDLDAVKGILTQDIDLATPDSAGEPPLLLAALAGHADVTAFLLERGADIETRNRGGLTALHAAAYAGKLDVVMLLVSKGASINDDRNFYRMSPLHAAAEEGHGDVVAFLLANKADIEAKERNGITPLSQAGWREHWDVAQLLLDAGAVCQDAAVVGEWLHGECIKRK
ncbi:Ankyrin [Rhizobium sp. PDO1-076]|uniref:ankyrin repeat domain-containing protein n=1 Tax=Rhizobium sp. PDO1-076 TaxID=1125979 RepID=UPI00024E38B5|nr:ankyrin repeat domain-containing protein [Rhizobium sp. PDO1-076]EHS53960.1 Ankyrin [Rhizobium sp. PDO1-076]